MGLESAPDTGVYVKSRKIASFFTGYKNKVFGIGSEANYVKDYTYEAGIDKYGFSVYGFIAVSPKFVVLARYDYLHQEFSTKDIINNYYIIGTQYEPVRFLLTSLNFRYYSKNDFPAIYLNVGFKF